MPFPTNAASTELDAVNQILSSVGQAPVSTLDLTNPEVAIVLNTLREVNKQVQGEGWVFNTERGIELEPVNEIIDYPLNALQVDANVAHTGRYDIVRRDSKLYDRHKHTNRFTENLKVDITYHFDFTEVPPPIQAYITARAARMCTVKMVGDAQLNQLLQEQEIMTRSAALEYECNQGDYSMFGFNDGEDYYTSYQPFQALKR